MTGEGQTIFKPALAKDIFKKKIIFKMSNNLKTYEQIFTETFAVKKDTLEKLEYNQIEQWDSIGHMTLISELEDKFSISMKPTILLILVLLKR